MSTGPRNRKAWRRGQRHREQIRVSLAAHNPLLPPLTAAQIRRQLELHLSERTIQWHMNAIRLEAELQALEQDSKRSAQFIT